MKIVLFQFNSTFLRPVLLQIVKELGVKEIHNFWPLPANHDIEQELPPDTKVYEYYDDLPALLTGNASHFDFEQLIPADNQILRDMAPYEHICKRTLQRYGKMSSELFNLQQKGILQFIDRWLNHIGYKYNSKNLSYNEVHELYVRLVRYWYTFFEKNQIDLVLSEFPPHAGMDNVGYSISKLKKIPAVFGYFTPGTAYQFFMNDYQNPQPKLFQLIAQLKEQYTPEELSFRPLTVKEMDRLTADANQQTIPFVGDFKKIAAIGQDSKPYKKIGVERKRKLYEKFLSEQSRSTKFFNSLASLFINSPLGKRASFEKKRDEFYEGNCSKPNFEKPFIYLPLHLQPEASSQPLGGFFEMQSLIVEMLRYHIPKDWFIYIKEHNKYSDYNYRPISFYKKMLQLSNVKLISRKVSTFHLIENCQAVAAVSGTAGWEGLFKNKPFLIFGHHISQYAPGAFPIRTNQDCQQAIAAIQNGVEIDINELKYFAKALDLISIPTTSSRYQFMQWQGTTEEWTEAVAQGYLNKIKQTLKTKYSAKV